MADEAAVTKAAAGSNPCRARDAGAATTAPPGREHAGAARQQPRRRQQPRTASVSRRACRPQEQRGARQPRRPRAAGAHRTQAIVKGAAGIPLQRIGTVLRAQPPRGRKRHGNNAPRPRHRQKRRRTPPAAGPAERERSMPGDSAGAGGGAAGGSPAGFVLPPLIAPASAPGRQPRQLFTKASRSALMTSAWVVHMPCGKPG